MDPSPVGLNSGPDLRREWELLLLDVARVRAWERLLFVGCGDGWIVEEASRRVLRGFACGLDRAPHQVARATQLRGVPGKLEFKTWDGTRLPCPSHSFQRVFSTFTLASGTDAATLLGELQRVLHPGGELYLLELGPSTRSGTLARTLVEAGFRESVELVRRVAGPLVGIILHARAADREAVPPAA